MKPLNVKEFAEQLRLRDNSDAEFAQEILDNYEFCENSEFEELCEDLTHISEKEFKEYSPRKQVDRIGDRLNVLDEIKEELQKHGFDTDPDDEVKQLIAVRCDIEKMLQDAGLWIDGELVDNIAHLIDNQPKTVYDL